MKRFLIAFVIAFTVGVLTSCSKDDDCTSITDKKAEVFGPTVSTGTGTRNPSSILYYVIVDGQRTKVTKSAYNSLMIGDCY